jgi:superfamily II DNA helicase RecQ
VQEAVEKALARIIASGTITITPSVPHHPSLGQVTLRTRRVLRDFLADPEAEFKSNEQAMALELALRNVQSALVILPTGGGKTLLFLAPIFAETDRSLFTVVVVPFKALMIDMLARCRMHRVHAQVWTSDLGHDHFIAQVLIVSADQVNESSIAWLRGIKHRIRGFFGDEIHEYFTPFRNKLLGTAQLLAGFTDKNIILSSATVSRAMQAQIQDVFGEF